MASEPASATTTVAVPDEARDRARELGWEDGLIDAALARGFSLQEVWQALRAGVDGATARSFLESGQRGPQPDLRWMTVPTEWGIRARPSDPAMGLTIGDINVGTYGDVPDTWPHRSEIARGSYPKPAMEDMGYTIFEKAVVWADCVVPLYEQAIRDRWAPATDLRWASLEALPEDVERAVSQLMTELSERSYHQGVELGRWLPEISYGFLEAKLFLSTVIFDLARHTEAFRKRALVNGGAVGLQAPTDYMRAVTEARSYPELLATLFIQDSTLLTLYRNGDRFAQSQLERDLFALAARDRERLLQYQVQRLKHYLFRHPERRDEQHLYFTKAENRVGKEWADPAVSGPLALLLSGGRERIADGLTALREFRRQQVAEYQAHLAAATIPRERLGGRLWAIVKPADA
jgi:hypothetical protein